MLIFLFSIFFLAACREACRPSARTAQISEVHRAFEQWELTLHYLDGEMIDLARDRLRLAIDTASCLDWAAGRMPEIDSVSLWLSEFPAKSDRIGRADSVLSELKDAFLREKHL